MLKVLLHDSLVQGRSKLNLVAFSLAQYVHSSHISFKIKLQLKAHLQDTFES